MKKDRALQILRNAMTEDQWNYACDNVKIDGQYPEWWYVEVIASGLAHSKSMEFRRSPGMTIDVVTDDKHDK